MKFVVSLFSIQCLWISISCVARYSHYDKNCTPDFPANTPLKCISYNLENITCTWNYLMVPSNENTTWNITYGLYKNQFLCKQVDLPNENTCMILSADNNYPFTLANLTLKLTIFHKLGCKTMKYHISHYGNVILKPPNVDTKPDVRSANITLKSVHPRKKWPIKYMYLQYKIKYESEWRKSETLAVDKHITLTNLVPNSQYNVSSCARVVPVYGDYNNTWSEPNRTTFRTKATVPDSWNALTVGSFATDDQRRELTVYWKALPKYKQNGDGFYYQVSVKEENLTNNRTDNTNDTSYTFNDTHFDRDYTVEVKGVNAVGESNDASIISIKKLDTPKVIIPSLPIMKDVVNLGNGSYYVEWVNKVNSSVTLFWCEVKEVKPEVPLKCEDGGINNTEIEQELSNTTLLLNENKTYSFAIATSAYNISRGLVWSFCEIPQNRSLIPKVSNVYLLESTISWKLPCKHRFRDIIGFNISCNNEYIFKPQAEVCKNKKKDCTYAFSNRSANSPCRGGTVTVVTINAKGPVATVTNAATKLEKNNDYNMIIIISVIIVGVVIVLLVYAYKKCVNDPLKTLKHLQLPPGIIEKTDVIDWNVNNVRSSSVTSITDEFKKLQRSTIPHSGCNNNGFTSEYVLSRQSSLDDCNHMSTENVQHPYLKKNYVTNVLLSSVEVIANDQQGNEKVQEVNALTKEPSDVCEYILEKSNVDVLQEPHSSGYTGISRVLSKNQVDQKCKDNCQSRNLLKESSSGFSEECENDIKNAKLCGEDDKLQYRDYVRISSSLVSEKCFNSLPSDTRGMGKSRSNKDYAKTFIAAPEVDEIKVQNNDSIDGQQKFLKSQNADETTVSTNQEKIDVGGYVRASTFV